MTPMQNVGTITWLKASIGKKANYYPTFSIFMYLQNHLHVLVYFDAYYCIILIVILTHSHSWYPVLYAHFSIFFTHFPPVALSISVLFHLFPSSQLLPGILPFSLIVALLISATGEPTSEQDTIKDMKHMYTSSLWMQQGKPIEGNGPHYEHRKCKEYSHLRMADPCINVKFWHCRVISPYVGQKCVHVKKLFANSSPYSFHGNLLDHGTDNSVFQMIKKRWYRNIINEKHVSITDVFIQINDFLNTYTYYETCCMCTVITVEVT